MKRILLASIAALGLAGTASAADLAVRAPVPVPLFTWTGCYLGINGGWNGGNDKISTSRIFPSGDPNRVVGGAEAINSGDGLPEGRAPLSAYNLVSQSFSSNQSAGT